MVENFRARTVVLAAMLLAATLAGGALLISRDTDEPKFCTLGVPIGPPLDVATDGFITSQERESGDGECGMAETNRGWVTVGWDCQVRDEDGTVMTTIAPTEPDGTCKKYGRSDEGPG